MVKRTEGLTRISDLVPAETLVTPVFNPQDIEGKELLINEWELKVSEKGGDYITFRGTFEATNLPFECTSFDKAIVAQLASIPEGANRPLIGKVTKFGRYYKLA